MAEKCVTATEHLVPDEFGQPGGEQQEQGAGQLGESLSWGIHLTSISQAVKCIIVEIELLSLRLARSLSLIPAQHNTDVLNGAAYLRPCWRGPGEPGISRRREPAPAR
jgi:hypothetical protein